MAEDSLFTYSEGTSFDTFYNPLFIPVFTTTFASPELAALASSMCGGDPFCLFDVAATGSTEIGLSTLQGNIEFETIVNITLPGENGTSSAHMRGVCCALYVLVRAEAGWLGK